MVLSTVDSTMQKVLNWIISILKSISLYDNLGILTWCLLHYEWFSVDSLPMYHADNNEIFVFFVFHQDCLSSLSRYLWKCEEFSYQYLLWENLFRIVQCAEIKPANSATKYWRPSAENFTIRNSRSTYCHRASFFDEVPRRATFVWCWN